MTPTPEQIEKLPKWARDHIKTLSRERETAIQALKEACDSEKPSPFYYENFDSTGEGRGPSRRRNYVQAHSMVCEFDGVRLTISAHHYNQQKGIQLSWDDPQRSLAEMAFIPKSYQQAIILRKEDMR